MRDWLIAECKKQTDSVSTQEFDHVWSYTQKSVKMYNVVASMNFGAQKTVLLIAHWDTRPYASEDPDPQNRSKPIIGANDGASGVAVLLELMRAFKLQKPKVNVTFLFTDGEDLGPELDEMFLGAKHFARTMKASDFEYGILLDMIGDKDLVVPKEPFSGQYARSVQTRFYANAQAIGLVKHFPNKDQGFIYDDHLALNEAGLPTIDLIDFTYEPWHTLADTPDKCSADSLSAIGKAVESFIRVDFR